MTISRPHSEFPWLKGQFRRIAGPWNRIGQQTKFYGRTITSIHYAFTDYRVELIRMIAQMGLGAGALIIIGGTVAIVGFLTVTTGALVAVQGYSDFSEIGVEALTGFASAFFNVRLIAPATTAIALSATIGAGATAQLGAMRISEEIDALEVMGIRSVAYLASTRVVAGLLVVIPVVLHRRSCVVLGGAFRDHRPLRPVDRRVRPLLQNVPEPDRLDLVVRSEHRAGGGDHADTHLLRLHRERRARRGRRGRRTCGA